MNDHPKHELFRSLGVFLGGIGILLAGIALLVWVLRPALPGGDGSITCTNSKLRSAESTKLTLEEMERLANDPTFLKQIEGAAKNLSPKKVEVKRTEIPKSPNP
jgi:hypothetical protein